jgi:hypothetical protein
VEPSPRFPRGGRRVAVFAVFAAIAPLVTALLTAHVPHPARARAAETAVPGPGPAAAAADTRPLVSFARQRLDERFFAEGAAVGDFNADGVPDVAAGPFWFAGPAFTERHAFAEPKAFDPRNYSDNFFAWSRDFNADGWDDILVYGFPGTDASWFENPRGAVGTWRRHVVLSQVDNE